MIKGCQSDILQIYEKIREQEQQSLNIRRKEINTKLPMVTSIERQIAKLSVELSINILNNVQNKDDYIKRIKDKITDLRVQKSELLVSYGYSIDYLEIHYRCSKCKDTGFINNKKCSCYKQKLIDYFYKNSSLNELIKKCNFSNFNFEYFSNNRSNSEPLSPRKNVEKIVSTCWNYIKNFNMHKEHLLFYGSSGTGKTFLSCCIAKELLDSGFLVVYRTADDLIQNLRQLKFNGDDQLEDLLYNCDLLIIDDLGSEQINGFTKTELFNFLNKKLLTQKKMIISTNYSLEEILKNYSERISSRLIGNFTLCKFYGEDIRIHKNFK